ncbi:Low temperature viability protein [Aspergillus campestris IBT 28561]|uniref:Low temperature viability protein n=1 Tax=Aspergillus campestris (strain IBT 28561) TaxID=1392248 RepID=A0A2I1D6E3_ASPC2|nr:Low temperature viability protein [Aspergillus campestris IBT 28561]PKY05446.1 Low temperature viability protein [Aspergillus campestris IBT 28561]
MPPRKQWIDKKNATTYQLFHRSQNDPRIHDPEADDRVLYQTSGPAPESSASSDAAKRAQNLRDLSSQFGPDALRQNEGEAANYGVYYDDSKYDYMQHLRELGTGGGASHFVEAASNDKGKGKPKMRLEDALRNMSVAGGSTDDDTQSQIYGSEMHSTASTYSRKPTYQDQQNVPDAIAGFQPDMDPRLREALEALEDEAFVDDEDDDVFGQLTSRAEEMEPGEWEDTMFDQDDYYDDEDYDDGWESDATEKAPVQASSTNAASLTEDGAAHPTAPGELPSHDAPAPDMPTEDQGWMREFAKFKKEAKQPKPEDAAAARRPGAAASVAPSELRSALDASTVFTAGGTPMRRKKRKGALTNPSAYSMTSSALARTEGHRLLDDRFDRVEALYALDEEDEELDDSMSMVSGATGMTGMTGMSTASSQAPSLIDANGREVAPRHDINNIMDDFLSGWDDKTGAEVKRKGVKNKRGKHGNEAIGIRMLDEVRQGLGPARVSGRAGRA